MIKVRLDNKATHEAMWNWCAKNPDKTKQNYPGYKTVVRLLQDGILTMPDSKHFIEHACPACQEACERAHSNGKTALTVSYAPFGSLMAIIINLAGVTVVRLMGHTIVYGWQPGIMALVMCQNFLKKNVLKPQKRLRKVGRNRK